MADTYKKIKLDRNDHAKTDKVVYILGPIVRVAIFPIMLIRKAYKWTYDL